MRLIILNIIDFFYFPFFKKWIPLRTFRYLACGGASTLLDLVVYYLSFHFIVHQQMVHLPFVTISGYIAAYIIAFCISFPVGFALSKYVVFPESYLRGRIQLVRYLLIVCLNILLNYLLLHFFVQVCHFFPTISKIIITVLLALFSYFSQRHFTFRMDSKIHKADKSAYREKRSGN